MAKTEEPEKAAAELRRELQRLVKTIVEDDDVNVEAIDGAHQTLAALKELTAKRSIPVEKTHESVVLPKEFLCPLSTKIMRDPVVVSTGETYDRPFIGKWLKDGNRLCPKTQQVLSHTNLTPNHLIQKMISDWCDKNGLQSAYTLERPADDTLTEANRDRFLSLLDKMSSTLPEQKESAKELRLLTKRMPSFRALFGESIEAIHQLLYPLLSSKSERDIAPELQEDIITTVLNLSIHDSNKKPVAESPMVIPLLLDALRSGTIETKSNAAAAIFTLSALDSNKVLIGKSGALKPLVDLLDEGHPSAMKDAASAIFNLCILFENRIRAVKDGAVRVVIQKIANRILVDELLAILAMLSRHQNAVVEMMELGAVPLLFQIIRETPCGRNKENCIVVLHAICFSDRSQWNEMREEEKTHGTMSQLAENGTPRAKRKASGILDRLNRAISLTHTA